MYFIMENICDTVEIEEMALCGSQLCDQVSVISVA